MYYRDHSPPHFHARYGDQEIVIEIETGKTSGRMSSRFLTIVQKWRKIYINELLDDWKLAEQSRPLNKIDPLE